ncbi:hypothetical protein M407DRAFT_33982 [Tulasnella calospora MUT 4182]|uniref:Uncharacterized protein n=1 Tax=Tulasnella calospora MUT 4182 TaxID=1051891 RepID=A0A0C3PPF1_9AGAM|nr:hypothetical protein M407DRAFT_33982 [Tulasnella calospora MUT 4182]
MLRNGKTYASATSSAGSESSYQYPTTITMDSTLHKHGVAALTDELFVVDSEIEHLTKANNNTIPEVDELQMPGKPDGGDAYPIPALPADAADAIPAKESLVANG